MKVIFFGRGPVAQPALALLQQQSWCQLLHIVTDNNFTNLPSADVGVVVDFGYLLPESLLSHFPLGIINIHPSLLPRWRGPSPIKTALLHGDTTTGVTIMKVDTGMDTGPILVQQEVAIEATETNSELEPRLAKLGAELLVTILPDYVAGKLQPIPQSNADVTLSKLIHRQDGELTTTLTMQDMWRRYRAYQPWPGVFFINNGKRYKITKAHWENDAFVCDQIQPEGKKPLAVADFKRGYPTVLFANVI